ncbi:thermonuclease family protein [Desulfolithobacter sp.]
MAWVHWNCFASRHQLLIRVGTGGLVLLYLLAAPLSPALAWHAYVVKVLDGDSLRVKKGNRILEIRLYGIDAPEYGQPYGDKAKRFASQLLYKKTVSLTSKDVDRYGRIVALVKSDGRLVNRELVREGFAWVYPKYCQEQPLCSSLKRLEYKARRARRGLWKAKNPVSPWRWKQQEHASGRSNRR